MSIIIDLTRELVDNLPVYPGDDAVRLYQTNFLEKDKFNNHRLETGMHVGTHIDAPMHMTERKVYINYIKLESLIGKGIIIDSRCRAVVGYNKQYEELIEENSIVLINTGFSEVFGTSAYFNEHSVISEEFAQLLVRKKVKALCMDTPSPDRYPFNIHKLLLKNDILIGENLANLNELKNYNDFEVFIIPLNIKADGSPARIFVRT